MRIRAQALFTLAFVAIASLRPATFQSADAQSSGIGLITVVTNTPGILSGNGTPSSKLSALLTTDGVTLSGTGAAGSPITYLLTSTEAGHFADGSHGALDFDGSATVAGYAPSSSVYTINGGDLYPTTMIVRTGVTVRTVGVRVIARNSIELAGTGKISSSGNNAVGATGGAACAGFTITGGKAGPNGGTGVGTAGTAGSVNTPRGWSVATGGSNAGSGGSGVSAGGSGGAAGAVVSTAAGDLYNLKSAIEQRFPSTDTFLCNGSDGCAPSGGAGGGNGTNAGGGGGGGACNAVVGAPVFTGTGTIEANGGAGGNGVNGATGTGGGGGGKGGIAVVFYSRGTAPTVTVTGGAKGLHGSGGGNDGNNGGDGMIMLYKVGDQ